MLFRSAELRVIADLGDGDARPVQEVDQALVRVGLADRPVNDQPDRGLVMSGSRAGNVGPPAALVNEVGTGPAAQWRSVRRDSNSSTLNGKLSQFARSQAPPTPVRTA